LLIVKYWRAMGLFRAGSCERIGNELSLQAPYWSLQANTCT
jgi:hypothetical protein